jgi:hypothetical protein
MIERSMLDQRPAWFVQAGRRGSGKTTAINMIVEAVTGSPAAASAWSTNEEERRKALLSYLMHGVPYILWDNIARGTQVSCPHIEKSCTSAFYADRKLGVSEMVHVAKGALARVEPSPGPLIFSFGRFAVSVTVGGLRLRFEVVLLSKDDPHVIGVADNAENALDLMDVAMRKYPDAHICVRCPTGILAERVPPRTPRR